MMLLMLLLKILSECVDLLGFSVAHAVAVADDGGPIYLKTSNGFTSVSDYNEAMEQKLLLI